MRKLDVASFFLIGCTESVAYAKIMFRRKRKETSGERVWNLCVSHVHVYTNALYTRAHARKRERSSEEPRFSEEIFPGSHFPGGLARPDRRTASCFAGFYRGEIRLREGQARATGGRIDYEFRLRECTRYARARARARSVRTCTCVQTLRNISLFSLPFFSFCLSRQKETESLCIRA